MKFLWEPDVVESSEEFKCGCIPMHGWSTGICDVLVDSAVDQSACKRVSDDINQSRAAAHYAQLDRVNKTMSLS